MILKKLSPMLTTAEVEATIKFYTELLGFECANYAEAIGWAVLVKDDVELMLSKPNLHIPFDAPHFTGSFYFTCDDVMALWGKIKDRVKVCYPLEDFPYGMREFACYDNNGYLLQFGQDIS